MALISKKKILYRINHQLRRYLKKYNREYTMNISYADLLRYDNAIVLYDKMGLTRFGNLYFIRLEIRKEFMNR